MNRHTKLVYGLVVLLVLCVAAYLGLRSWNAEQEKKAADTPKDYVMQLSALTSLSWERDGATLSFQKNSDGVWTSADSPDLPLDQSELTALEDDLAGLTATKVIPDPEADSSYGLDAPVLRVTAATAAGETSTLLVGSSVSGGYYAKVEGEASVYTISGGILSDTDHTLMSLVALDTIPTVTEDSLTSIVLEQDGNTHSVTKDQLESATDAQKAAVDALPGLSFIFCDSFRPDTATLTAAGMDAPAKLTVTYEGGGYTLLIGSQDSSGSYYYARLEGSDQLNLVTATTAKALLGLAEESAQ